MSYLKRRKADTERAAILIISLWILAILSMFAIGIGHKLSVEIRLLRNQIDDTKAFYIAKAGLEGAIAERASVIKSKKTIYADGYHQPWMNNEDMFKGAKFADGVYTVSNQEVKGIYGLSDEQSKININKAEPIALKIFFKEIEPAEDIAAGIAACIVDWRDEDKTVINVEGSPISGAEDNVDPPYHPKNSDFDSVEELLLVKGMTQELFEKAKDFVTVYGESKLININTAPYIVLVSVLSNETTATYVINARKGVEDKLGQRWFINEEKAPAEDADRIINIKSASGTTPEETAALGELKEKLGKSIDVKSSVFKINSTAEVRGIKSTIEAVVKIDPDDGTHTFLSWRQR